MKGAIYVERSNNRKITGDHDHVDATYVSIDRSCPDSCSLKDQGCYAQGSYVGMINRRMNRRARGLSPLQVARAEAHAIDASYGGRTVPTGRPLRLHVAGDSRTVKGTRLINNAIKRWKARGGGQVWSYTHAWSHVPRQEWSQVSILASLERTDQVELARQQGYAPAMVVNQHISYKAYVLPGSQTKWIPCPQQTRNVPCVECRLCFNASRLYQEGMGIAFAVHGVKENQLKKHLTVLQNGE